MVLLRVKRSKQSLLEHELANTKCNCNASAAWPAGSADNCIICQGGATWDVKPDGSYSILPHSTGKTKSSRNLLPFCRAPQLQSPDIGWLLWHTWHLEFQLQG